MPGLWGQRFWAKFQKVIGREFIEFDEFIYSLYQICRSPEAEQDKFIFDMFNLGQKPNMMGQKQKKEITKEEFTAMIYNLPFGTIIVSKIKAGYKEENQNKENPNPKHYSYQIQRNPNPKSHERLILGETKLLTIQPTQMKAIVDDLISAVSPQQETLNFDQFKAFLDLNPALRSIILGYI